MQYNVAVNTAALLELRELHVGPYLIIRIKTFRIVSLRAPRTLHGHILAPPPPPFNCPYKDNAKDKLKKSYNKSLEKP